MALTVNEMADLIGAGWYKDTNGGDTLIFPVDVIDARVVWGNLQVLITPQGDAARGKRWVSRDKVVTGLSVTAARAERERAAGIIGTLKEVPA